MALEFSLLAISVVVSVVVVALITVLFPSKAKKEKKEEKPTKSHSSHSSSSHSAPAAAPAPAPVAAPAPAAAAEAPAAAKPKKAKKANKPKASKAKKPNENKFENLVSSAAEGDDEPSDDDSVASDAIIPSKAAQAILKKSKELNLLAKEAKEKAEKAKAAPEPEKEKEKAPEKKEEKPKAKKAEPKKAAKKNGKDKKAPEPAAPVDVPAPAEIAATESKTEVEAEVKAEAVPAPDGWAVVEDRRKSKPKKDSEDEAPVATNEVVVEAPKEEEEDDEPPKPQIEVVTADVVVDASKLGFLIGPKGATKISIQQATGTIVQMPKTGKETTGDVTVVVSGPREGVDKAVAALTELATKGFASLLVPEGFQESYVAVHPKYLPDIIGKSGSVIRALNNHTGVKITVPTAPKQPGPDGKISKVKIGLAGQKDKVSQCRALIKDLTKFYVTEVTHPGQTYAELEIAKNYYNYIIGSKGSEIKHIQNSYKVQVHIPDEYSVNPNVLIVGEEANVQQAKKHIEKIIDRVNGVNQEAEKKANGENNANAANADNVAAENAVKPVAPPAPGLTQQQGGKSTWANNNNNNTNPRDRVAAPPKPPVEEPEEAWTRDFLPPAMGVNIGAMLPAGAKYSSVQPIGPNALQAADKNPTPSGLPTEPKAPPTTAWNINTSQW